MELISGQLHDLVYVNPNYMFARTFDGSVLV
jgi:hypothetical protein